MRLGTRGLLRTLSISALLMATAGLAVWRLDMASGQGTVLNLVAPSSVAGAGEFQVTIEIQNASLPETGCPDPEGDKMCGVASYEWVLNYDPALLELKNATNGAFLGSTGRAPVSCFGPFVGPAPGVEAGQVRFGCGTIGGAPPGPGGSGLLTTLTFSAVAAGPVDIQFACAGLGDPFGNSLSVGNVPDCASPVTPTPGPSETPGPTETPGLGSTPEPTGTPTGPVPTPTPVPPGWEPVPLVQGCQFQAWTGADGTTPDQIAALVGPAGNLISLWAMQPGPVWRGYSPQYPHVSDMEPVDLLDVVAICTTGPGDFVRPII